ncbi:MAG TPA: hypothetical protein VHE58_02125 [Burkholderiales bacterium]|nr:hypothetical protein [Burkholderiales bacterium]
MDIFPLKLFGAIAAPLKWVHRVWFDQTRIEVLFPQAANWPWRSVPVFHEGNNGGLLLFSVTTQSKRPVEVTRVEVHYAAPLQLLDPGNRGFFIGSGTLNNDLPFCVQWNGSLTVRADVQQAFAVAARFPNRVEEQNIRICIHARRQHEVIGGFSSPGRCRITTKEYQARLISEPLIGFRVPPLCSLTTPQPFLIEKGQTATTAPGESTSIIVHTRDADGTASSTRIKLPGA